MDETVLQFVSTTQESTGKNSSTHKPSSLQSNLPRRLGLGLQSSLQIGLHRFQQLSSIAQSFTQHRVSERTTPTTTHYQTHTQSQNRQAATTKCRNNQCFPFFPQFNALFSAARAENSTPRTVTQFSAVFTISHETVLCLSPLLYR